MRQFLIQLPGVRLLDYIPRAEQLGCIVDSSGNALVDGGDHVVDSTANDLVDGGEVVEGCGCDVLGDGDLVASRGHDVADDGYHWLAKEGACLLTVDGRLIRSLAMLQHQVRS